MAKIVLVETCSHTPFLRTDPMLWNEIRRLRPNSEKNPWTTDQENVKQYARAQAAFGVLKDKLEAAKPDVILVFGDDQIEQFDFSLFPPFAIFAGENFEGYKVFPRTGIVPGQRGDWVERTPETWAKVKGHPDLAKHLLKNLVRNEFDVSFMLEEHNKEHGVGHAFLRPMSYILPDYDLPILPFYINCFYGPQPTANRVYQIGRTVRTIIEEFDSDLRVAVLGSGGLWHTPGNPEGWLNEDFDTGVLDNIRSGDAKALADHFDRESNDPPAAYGNGKWVDGGTGMYLGLGSGTGETRNWVAAAAMVDGIPGTIVDYIPVYASPCGVSFAYWENP